MSFLMSDAFAAGPAPAASGVQSLIAALPFVAAVAIFYFLLMRPQQKRAKEHRELVKALAPGDEVLTTGGVAGRVRAIDDQFVTLEIAANVQIQVQRHAVQTLLLKGTLKF